MSIQMYFNPGNHVLFYGMVKIIYIFCQNALVYVQKMNPLSSMAQGESHCSELERLISDLGTSLCVCPAVRLGSLCPSVTVIINMETP